MPDISSIGTTLSFVVDFVLENEFVLITVISLIALIVIQMAGEWVISCFRKTRTAITTVCALIVIFIIIAIVVRFFNWIYPSSSAAVAASTSASSLSMQHLLATEEISSDTGAKSIPTFFDPVDFDSEDKGIYWEDNGVLYAESSSSRSSKKQRNKGVQHQQHGDKSKKHRDNQPELGRSNVGVVRERVKHHGNRNHQEYGGRNHPSRSAQAPVENKKQTRQRYQRQQEEDESEDEESAPRIPVKPTHNKPIVADKQPATKPDATRRSASDASKNGNTGRHYPSSPPAQPKTAPAKTTHPTKNQSPQTYPSAPSTPPSSSSVASSLTPYISKSQLQHVMAYIGTLVKEGFDGTVAGLKAVVTVKSGPVTTPQSSAKQRTS
jgi:hypothetical protein